MPGLLWDVKTLLIASSILLVICLVLEWRHRRKKEFKEKEKPLFKK